MGQRMGIRGEADPRAFKGVGSGLQWGSGWGSAESSGRWTLGCSPIPTLQWGRGWGSAESGASLLPLFNQGSLQWGRGWGSAESRERPRLDLDHRRASMGPRMGIRGKGGAHLADAAPPYASMEPRMGIRGKRLRLAWH